MIWYWLLLPSFSKAISFMWLDVTLHLVRSFINLIFFLLFLFILLLIGFLTFHVACVCRTSAEEAIQRMQGKMIGQQVIQISWGSSTSTARQVIVPLETVHFLTKWLNTSLNYIMINIICTFEIYENENHLIINLSSFKFYKIWHK